jgi:hypothetical protein
MTPKRHGILIERAMTQSDPQKRCGTYIEKEMMQILNEKAMTKSDPKKVVESISKM